MIKNFELTDNSMFSVNLSDGCFADIVVYGQRLNCGKVSLFAVKLRDKNGCGKVISAEDCRFIGFDGVLAKYTCDYVDVAVRFSLSSDNSALSLRMDVTNRTDLLVEWVELMSVCVGGKLRDEEGGTGAIVYPFNEGGLVTNMAFRESMPYRYDEPQYPSKSGY